MFHRSNHPGGEYTGLYTDRLRGNPQFRFGAADCRASHAILQVFAITCGSRQHRVDAGVCFAYSADGDSRSG